MKTKSLFQMFVPIFFLFVFFFAKFCQTKVTVKGNIECKFLDLQLLAFSDSQQTLTETVKRPLQLWKKSLRYVFLNVTMDICYKAAKHKEESRTILKKKIAHTKLSGENLSMAENTTCYTHINSAANVVQSNFL